MNRFVAAIAATILTLIFGFIAPAGAADTVSAPVVAALKDTGRDPAERPRDATMMPAQVLGFAQVKPGQVVVDFVPGDGYYTRILSKLVGDKGHLYALVPFAGAINAETIRREHKNPVEPVDTVLALQNLIHYRNLTVIWQFIGLDGGAFGIPYQADVVWNGNYHVLHVEKLTDTKDLTGPNKELFDSVKNGGFYVVSDAAAAKGTGFADAEKLGRVDPEAVKKELLAAGFVLDGESNLLANPADDHTKPSAEMNGKADRFLLRFKKPMNAPKDMRAEGMQQAKVLYGNTWISGMGKDLERRLFYHPDGSYEELGKVGSLLQQGYWFLDSHARVCILHQFPAVERGYIICSKKLPVKIGDKWTTQGRRGESIITLADGIRYMGEGP